MKQPRSGQYYRSVKNPRPELYSCMREIAYTRVLYGYRRVHVLFCRGGWQLGRSQAYRLRFDAMSILGKAQVIWPGELVESDRMESFSGRLRE